MSNEIEQRLSTLEREMAELKSRIAVDSRAWPDKAFGALQDIDQGDFEEFVRFGKEFRDSQTDPEEN